jgi:hypothetical protein
LAVSLNAIHGGRSYLIEEVSFKNKKLYEKHTVFAFIIDLERFAVYSSAGILYQCTDHFFLLELRKQNTNGKAGNYLDFVSHEHLSYLKMYYSPLKNSLCRFDVRQTSFFLPQMLVGLKLAVGQF